MQKPLINEEMALRPLSEKKFHKDNEIKRIAKENEFIIKVLTEATER